jgi:hypothetical protein
MDPEPPKLAITFHRFPHLNASLHKVNSTFDTGSEVYLTSLGLLGSLPAITLILILTLLLLYLLTRCCEGGKRSKGGGVAWVKALLATGGLICW